MKGKKSIIYNIILAMIIAVGLSSIIYCFSVKKEGWHSDEVWSYGFANSYYEKEIYLDSDNTERNVNEWVDSSVIRDYIEVNDGERFKFDSVYNNQVEDLSPPLHSMVLHAICSLFPNTFSWWYSFSINIVAYLITMIYLFKVCKILKNEKLGLICCFMYGLSLAARDTYIYLRMYAMCTALTMIYLYNLVKWLKRDDRKNMFTKNLVGIFVATLSMFLTHYYMISLVGVITLCVCVWLLCEKKIKNALIYGGMQFASLAVSFGLFPSAIKMFLSHQEGVSTYIESTTSNIHFAVKIRILFNFIFYKLYGIFVPVTYDFLWLKVIILIIIMMIIILLPLLFLLRNTQIIISLNAIVKKAWGKLILVFVKSEKIYWVICIAIVCQMFIVASTAQIVEMGSAGNRYIMYIYPLVTLLVGTIVYDIVRVVHNNKISNVLLVLVLVGVLVVNISTRCKDTDYYFKENVHGVSLKQAVEKKDCFFLASDDWAIAYMSPILLDSKKYFQTSMGKYKSYVKEYENVNKDDVVLIVDVTRLKSTIGIAKMAENGDEVLKKVQKEYDDVLQFYKEVYSANTVEKVSEQKVFGRAMEAYVFR